MFINNKNLTFNNFNLSSQNDSYMDFEYADYEVDNSFDTGRLLRFIPSAIIYSLTFIIGSLGIYSFPLARIHFSQLIVFKF